MSARILLLTFFYPPDLCAGSFRASALVEALQLCAGNDLHIDVLTTQPNRYTHHAFETDSIEEMPGLRVRRVHLPGGAGGSLKQVLSFWRYARKVSRLTADQEYDLVVATSSRLLTAVLGAWVARRLKSSLYLDIRDIFVENLKVLFPRPVATSLGWVFGTMERWTINRASKVNLVSHGFMGYFQPRYPMRQFSIFSNGVDEAFNCSTLYARPAGAREGQPLQVLYAGNIGDGQGLHHILPELAERMSGRVHFRVVGDGGRVEALREKVRARALSNVELLPPVERAELIAQYQKADVLFLHLNDFPAFRRVLPSKLFEYAATGKPIWAGVAGYSADLVSDEISNSAVFNPCDVDGAIKAFERLSLAQASRLEFVARYSRSRIMKKMANDVLELLEVRDGLN